MLRHGQYSLAQLLAWLSAIQIVCAAAAGAFGEWIQWTTLATLALLCIAVVRLIAEGLIEIAVDGLAAALAQIPLQTRPPALAPRRW